MESEKNATIPSFPPHSTLEVGKEGIVGEVNLGVGFVGGDDDGMLAAEGCRLLQEGGRGGDAGGAVGVVQPHYFGFLADFRRNRVEIGKEIVLAKQRHEEGFPFGE